jgi:hypothetical protein
VTLKDQAEFFALALESGLKTVPDVIAWADENIAQLETPPLWLLELSLLSKARGQDVVHALRQAEGTSDPPRVVSLWFGLLLDHLRTAEVSAESMVMTYCSRPDTEWLPEPIQWELMDFDRRYSITEVNLELGYPITDPLEDIDRDFLAFLERESGR